nr:hypothetical protein [Nocardia brevicatena]
MLRQDQRGGPVRIELVRVHRDAGEQDGGQVLAAAEELFDQPALGEDLGATSVDAGCARLADGACRAPLHHDDFDSCESQFGGEHKAGRAGARNDDSSL